MSNQGENVQPLAKTWTAFSWDRPYPCKAREMLFHALVNAPSSEDGASWGRGGGIRRWIDCANAADTAPCSRPSASRLHVLVWGRPDGAWRQKWVRYAPGGP